MSDLPKLPAFLRYARTPAEQAGFKIDQGVVPLKWAFEKGVADVAARTFGAEARRRYAKEKAEMTEEAKNEPTIITKHSSHK